MEDLTGRQFGAYQIVAPLGEGGMAAVYKAYQPAVDRYVAIKVLPRQYAADPQFVARFQREAKALAQLQHPHILPVFDFGETDGYTWLVMPFVPHGTLTDLLQGQPLPLVRVRKILTQLGLALQYAHARGLVHRDVKPSNVLLDESGNCLLSDFGLARMAEASVKLTTSGSVLGTPAYMSPEQGAGKAIDGRSDLYSLGVIFYELVTGRVPYRAETPVAVIFKHISDPLPPARELNPALPEPVERVLLKSLAKRPEDRFQTAAEMVAALQAAIPETGQPTALPPPPPIQPATLATPASHPPIATPVTTKTALPGWVWFAAGLGIVALVGVAGAATLWPLLNPPEPPLVVITATLPVTTDIPLSTATSAPEATVPVTAIAATPTALPVLSLTPPASLVQPVVVNPAATFSGRIAFVSYRDRDEEIYVMNADGSGQTRLTDSPLADREPMFSPDGRTIVFVSQRAGGHNLFIMNADGSNQRQLTDGVSKEEYSPYFSPDGQWIVYSSTRGRRFELWLIRPDGSDLRQLTGGPNSKSFPAWSPDGQWIAYNSVSAGSDVIKVIRPDGGDDRIILRQDEAYVTGWIGNRILFAARNGETTDIFSMYPDGSDVRQLTTHVANDRGAYGTPDGQFIVFNSARDGNDELYVMRGDGSQPVRLTFEPGNDFMPTWSNGVVGAPVVFGSSTVVSPGSSAAPSCPAVEGPFAEVWAQTQNRLGCASGPATRGLIAEENFVSGKMFWREPVDHSQVLVLFANGTWKIYRHTPFIEGSPEFKCVDANTPAQSPPTPKRGFGSVWCDIPEVRRALGNAVDEERGYQGDLQTFERGFALRTDAGQVFVFYNDGRWERR
jgi:serine/threonine protein kinase